MNTHETIREIKKTIESTELSAEGMVAEIGETLNTYERTTNMLQVFRGECETINGDHGLYHRDANGSVKIVLRHLIDPVSGYSLELYATHAGGGEESRAHFLMSPAEALGICEAFTGSMRLIAFGA